jgi:hypothetical protein
MGLIAQAESEAQLAYILCHEISHYTKQHHINGFVLNDRIDQGRYDGNTEEKQIEKCQYSKEYESEADAEGFKLFERTTYDLKQAEKGFTVLQYSHLPFELAEIKKTFFESTDYVLPADYFLKQFNPIKDNSNEDDSKMTHPNTKKRRQAIAQLINERDNTGRVKALVGEKEFTYIRDLCRMELCRLYLKNRDYPNAFYASYLLSQTYPENQFVAETMSKSLYGISLFVQGEIKYNSDSYLSSGFPSHGDVESYPEQIYQLMEKMNAHEWAILSLNKVYRYHKRFPENSELKVLSDSLFKLLGRTEWKAGSFARKRTQGVTQKPDSSIVTQETKSKTELIASLQEQTQTSHADTVYYRNVFLDLFESDPEFVKRFPEPNYVNQTEEESSFSISGRRSYHSNSHSQNRNPDLLQLHGGVVIDTLMLLEPFYFRIDQREKQSLKYISSDEKQEEYLKVIDECATLQNITIIKMDPGLIGATDAEKMNDLSVINDWFEERFDSEIQNKAILNTDEIQHIIAKYGTHYVLRTGIANVINQSGKKRTYFFGFLFDLQKNEMVYRRYEAFPRLDHQDLIHSKTYQLLYDLKHPQEQEDD